MEFLVAVQIQSYAIHMFRCSTNVLKLNTKVFRHSTDAVSRNRRVQRCNTGVERCNIGNCYCVPFYGALQYNAMCCSDFTLCTVKYQDMYYIDIHMYRLGNFEKVFTLQAVYKSIY